MKSIEYPFCKNTMKTKLLPSIVSALLIIVFLFTLTLKDQAPELAETNEQTMIAQSIGLDLTADQMRADAIVDALPITEVLGSLAPIALSPFFALTCLSGASLLASEGLLPESVSSNYLLGANSPLHNEAVFLGLLCLTVMTSLPKLTKVSKPFAQAVDQVEAYSGIIAALAVQILSRVGTGESSMDNEVAVVYSAGIITASYSMLLMVFSVINIFVVNSVKFFFEMMILISPFPTVDAFFEAANKAFAAFLIAVYLFSPWLATWLNLLIFLVSLLIFSWTYRRVVFMKSAISDPLFGWFAESIFGMRKMTATATKLPRKLEERFEGASVVMKAFPGKRMKGVS
jgi:hypothetical protein